MKLVIFYHEAVGIKSLLFQIKGTEIHPWPYKIFKRFPGEPRAPGKGREEG
jgi:hypothetical protein